MMNQNWLILLVMISGGSYSLKFTPTNIFDGDLDIKVLQQHFYLELELVKHLLDLFN